jgi:ribosomal protein L11 methyltransferase
MRNLTPRIILYPASSLSPKLQEGWIALPYDETAEAFGDGSHPTTRLCAGAVDLICRQENPHAVLDVGTGTGILARIARARGAQFIVGTDIDPKAIAIARDHAALDASEVSIHFNGLSPDQFGARFDLVVANILEAPLRALAPALARALLPGGVILLSGFTRIQIPALRMAYVNEGLSFVNESFLEEWALLMLRCPL